MKAALDLSKVVGGFSDTARDSQIVFRQALDALSQPGKITPLTLNCEIPQHANAGSAVLLLALLDADSQLWLSPSLKHSDAAHWIAFHSNCIIVQDPSEAHFAWVENLDELPALSAFNQGTDEYPDQSTTIILDVNALSVTPEAMTSLTLQGPGIAHTHTVCLDTSTAQPLHRLIGELKINHAQFPKGVDLFMASADHVIGLPRTTRINFTAPQQNDRA
jgi:alpha-D-ribose 1-methylphosphonate 5-triphosphate synthase subunit PhnH